MTSGVGEAKKAGLRGKSGSGNVKGEFPDLNFSLCNCLSLKIKVTEPCDSLATEITSALLTSLTSLQMIGNFSLRISTDLGDASLREDVGDGCIRVGSAAPPTMRCTGRGPGERSFVLDVFPIYSIFESIRSLLEFMLLRNEGGDDAEGARVLATAPDPLSEFLVRGYLGGSLWLLGHV